MRYAALVGDEERQVEITELSSGEFQIIMDGRTLQIDARTVSDTTLSLLHGDQIYDVESESSPNGGATMLVRGHCIPVEVLDLRALRLRKAQETVGGDSGPVEIRSPMPGKVVAVLVEEGQEVKEGDGLVVVEAMKMENELRSPHDGIVRKLKAEEGATVDGGASLCIIE